MGRRVAYFVGYELFIGRVDSSMSVSANVCVGPLFALGGIVCCDGNDLVANVGDLAAVGALVTVNRDAGRRVRVWVKENVLMLVMSRDGRWLATSDIPLRLWLRLCLRLHR
jgi:hypothetical protein